MRHSDSGWLQSEAKGRSASFAAFAKIGDLIYDQEMRQAVEPRLDRWALNKVHNTDALVGLQGVASDSLDVAITSPPYWGQRGSNGIGSEPDPRDYIKNLTAILAETM